MSWSLYRWVWRIEAPLYVGMPPAQALSRSRLYVPARNLWAAFTAELAQRKMGNNPTNHDQYDRVGKSLLQSCRFSYLYPAKQVAGRWIAWSPCFENGKGLCWKREDGQGSIPDAEMRRQLLNARLGTAIEPGSGSAAEGSLHETECVHPFWRSLPGDTSQPVGMAGYVFQKDTNDEINQIDELSVGGDTRYGLGKIVRVKMEQAQNLFGYEVNLSVDDPRVYSTEMLAHARIENNNTKILGGLEMLKGWNVGSLAEVDAMPLWVPGSICETTLCFEFTPKGIWKRSAS